MFQRVLVTGGSGFIGTNLIDHYVRGGAGVANLDSHLPRNPAHKSRWIAADLLDANTIRSAVHDWKPELVIHLGARTDLEGCSVADYRANTDGLKNLLETLVGASSIKRVLFASSLLVCRLGYQPRDDDDYCPNTAYGESKALGEQILRSAGTLPFVWAILRPTSIWGPWFAAPYRKFFEAVRKGIYVHPRGVESLRSYGFVLNSVEQINAIGHADSTQIHGRVFYVADYEPIELKAWADLVSNAFGRGPVREVPRALLSAAARLGDLLKLLGYGNAPLSSFRLRNLLTPAVYDLSRTRTVCPVLPYTLREGVEATVSWIRARQL